MAADVVILLLLLSALTKSLSETDYMNFKLRSINQIKQYVLKAENDNC